jgi:ZIP family zinc transporter
MFAAVDSRILAIVLLSMGGSTVLGVLGGILIRRIPHSMNDLILGFAAGIMLAAAVLGLISPAFAQNGSVLIPVVGVFAGAAAISFLDRIVPHLHRLAGLEGEKHVYNGTVGKTLLFVSALALHKVPEGLATGVSFGTDNLGDIVTVAGSVSLQNIPEAFVVVAPLVSIGVSMRRVVGISFSIAAVSMVCVIAGCALVSVFAAALPFLLSTAGGAMLYVISDEMIPETHSHGYEKSATFALITGFLLVLVLQRLLAASA